MRQRRRSCFRLFVSWSVPLWIRWPGTSLLCQGQTGYYDIRVVRETQTIRPVSGFQLAAGYEPRLIISGHHRPVDRAFDITALNRERDILSDGLALPAALWTAS